MLVVVALALSACASLEPIEFTQREQIEFESSSFPGRLWDPLLPEVSDGTEVTIEGLLTIPPTDRPVPAIVMTHGCGGISSAESGWIREFELAGYASFSVRSFAARDVSSICTGEESVSIASMIYDVYRAREVLDEHPYIDGSRVAILGFSFGGRTALWSASTRFQERYDGRGFAAHLAFYPSTCFIRLEDEADVSGGPIRIFHGTADDWTPIEQCRAYVSRLRAADVDARIFEYEGARHGFDDANLPEQMPVSGLSPRNCEFVERNGAILDADTGGVAGVDSPCVESGVSIGFDADARAQAGEDLFAVLSDVFGG